MKRLLTFAMLLAFLGGFTAKAEAIETTTEPTKITFIYINGSNDKSAKKCIQ